MKKPEYLKKGDTIAITAPSFGATIDPYETRLTYAVKTLEEKGYKVIVGDTCHKSDGKGISTDPRVCARELEDFYLDPEIDAVFSCGGGELMCETAGYIDFERLKDAKPKWFMGYSDNTNFIFPLLTKTDTMALYGICAPTLGQEWDQATKDHMDVLEGKASRVKGYPFHEDPHDTAPLGPLEPCRAVLPKKLRIWTPGKGNSIDAEGILIGGCLDVINNLAGTSLEDVKGFKQRNPDLIWVLEACDYNPMDIRRSLWHLDKCGWFTGAKAFVIGRPLAAWGESMMGVDQYNAVTDILAKYNVPILMDADVGHIDPTVPVIMGSRARLWAMDDDWSLDFMD